MVLHYLIKSNIMENKFSKFLDKAEDNDNTIIKSNEGELKSVKEKNKKIIIINENGVKKNLLREQL